MLIFDQNLLLVGLRARNDHKLAYLEGAVDIVVNFCNFAALDGLVHPKSELLELAAVVADHH